MSVDVLREVFRLSQSKGVARNVLTVLADAAHPDGVTWLPIEPSKDGDPTRCITHRANASRRAVIDAIAALEEAGEIESRKAQRGQRRISVYRVVLGSIGGTSVDYSDMPFVLEHPFSDGVQILHVVSNEENGVTECSSRDDEVQISSPRGADVVIEEGAENVACAGDSTPQRVPEASSNPSGEPPAADQDLQDPAAAARPATDAEVREAVASFPGADAGSHVPVLNAGAAALPAAVFREQVDRVRQRGGDVGLLITFLRIAANERATQAQLAFAETVNARPRSAAPWALEVIKRADPARYVRLMAANPAFPRDLLAEALAEQASDDLLALFDAVRAGTEARDPIGTPEQERRRWVTANADHPDVDVDVVIDGWHDADDVERQELHELAEQLRSSDARSAAVA